MVIYLYCSGALGRGSDCHWWHSAGYGSYTSRESSSFLECVPVKVVDHSGHTLPLTVVVRDKSSRTTLGVFNFSYLLPGVWVPYGATIF